MPETLDFIDFTLTYKRMNNGEVPVDQTIFTCLNMLRDKQNEIIIEIKKQKDIGKLISEIKKNQKVAIKKLDDFLDSVTVKEK